MEEISYYDDMPPNLREKALRIHKEVKKRFTVDDLAYMVVGDIMGFRWKDFFELSIAIIRQDNL